MSAIEFCKQVPDFIRKRGTNNTLDSLPGLPFILREARYLPYRSDPSRLGSGENQRVAAAISLTGTVCKHNCEDCVSHSGFTARVHLIRKPSGQTHRTLGQSIHIRN
jgi:hypothetical protein